MNLSYKTLTICINFHFSDFRAIILIPFCWHTWCNNYCYKKLTYWWCLCCFDFTDDVWVALTLLCCFDFTDDVCVALRNARIHLFSPTSNYELNKLGSFDLINTGLREEKHWSQNSWILLQNWPYVASCLWQGGWRNMYFWFLFN